MCNSFNKIIRSLFDESFYFELKQRPGLDITKEHLLRIFVFRIFLSISAVGSRPTVKSQAQKKKEQQHVSLFIHAIM